jgi:hypothetical protein
MLEVGDEEKFLTYEERVVFDLQKAWSEKSGMIGCPVVDLCAKLEDLIYNDTLKEYNLSSTANVWSKKECILFYQEKTDLLLRNVESKDLNWKKLYDESKMNPRYALQTIMKSENDRKFKAAAPDYKSASRALMPNARKSAIGFNAESVGRRNSTGRTGGKGKRGIGGGRGAGGNLRAPSPPRYAANATNSSDRGGYGLDQGNSSSGGDIGGGIHLSISGDAGNLLGDGNVDDGGGLGLGFDFDFNNEDSHISFAQAESVSADLPVMDVEMDDGGGMFS